MSPELLYDAIQPDQLEYQLCKAAAYRYYYDDQVQFIDPDTQAVAVATLDEWLELYNEEALTPELAIEILRQGVAGAPATPCLKISIASSGVKASSL